MPLIPKKTVLITGSSAGIGLYTAIGLAQENHRVIVHARNAQKGKKALQTVIEQTGNSDIHLLTADLASFAEIRKMSQEFNQQFDQLDVLVNNAGCVFTEYGETQDGFERQWGINHLAPFLLTHLLLPSLQKAPNSRIVNVSSGAHKRSKMRFEKFKDNYKGMVAYGQSKLANILFTYEWARRFKDQGITANCLHPGVVKTDIGSKNSSGIVNMGWKVLQFFAISQEQGAQTSIYLASSPEVEGKTGAYYYKNKIDTSSALSHDEALAKKLWDISLEQTGLKQTQKET